MVEKLINKGYSILSDEEFGKIAAEAAAGAWNIRKVFHTCEFGGYEAVDARGRVHGTDCCGSMGVLQHYKLQAARAKAGPLKIKADINPL